MAGMSSLKLQQSSNTLQNQLGAPTPEAKMVELNAQQFGALQQAHQFAPVAATLQQQVGLPWLSMSSVINPALTNNPLNTLLQLHQQQQLQLQPAQGASLMRYPIMYFSPGGNVFPNTVRADHLVALQALQAQQQQQQQQTGLFTSNNEFAKSRGENRKRASRDGGEENRATAGKRSRVDSASTETSKAPSPASRTSSSSPSLPPSSSSSTTSGKGEGNPKSGKRTSKLCTMPNCTTRDKGGGFCAKHGGGRACKFPGCTKIVAGARFCTPHGGRRKKVCSFQGCTKGDQGGGFCASHGGGRRCTVEGCTRRDIGKGRCWSHGGGRRCAVMNCNKGPINGGAHCKFHQPEAEDDTASTNSKTKSIPTDSQ
jgi:hypothetical protein